MIMLNNYLPDLDDKDAIDKLCSFYFRLSRIDDTSSVEPIRLMRDGTIYGHSHPNEHSWRIVNGRIAFLNKEGVVSTLFNRYEIDGNGKLLMSGDFVLKPQLSIQHKLQQIDFIWEDRERFKSLTKNILRDDINKFKWEVGDHTYGKPSIYEPGRAKLKIGKFCSIASGVALILGNHRMDTVTTYPFVTLKKYWPGIKKASTDDHHSNGDINIGNDVWIGHAATILSGVTVGDGAIIAAHSLVTKDVEPYSIVGGVPARKISLRHPENIIDSLVKIKWWNWDDEIIDSRLEDMTSDVHIFIEKYGCKCDI